MTGYIGTVPALEAFLPRLRQAMEDSGVLLVLDNLETLLTPDGSWRDPRWKSLMTALTSHDGESRVILTSRIVPTGLAVGTMRLPADDDADEDDQARQYADSRRAASGSSPGTEAAATRQPSAVGDPALTLPVHALSLQESIALARELPHLRELLHADTGAIRDPDDVEANAHTTERMGPTPPATCLEDSDRQSNIVEANWADLWHRLERPGDPPAPGPLLSALARAALVEAEPISVTSVGDQTGAGDFRVASVAAGDLINVLMAAQRPDMRLSAMFLNAGIHPSASPSALGAASRTVFWRSRRLYIAPGQNKTFQ
jgi:hypothetical protein